MLLFFALDVGVQSFFGNAQKYLINIVFYLFFVVPIPPNNSNFVGIGFFIEFLYFRIVQFVIY